MIKSPGDYNTRPPKRGVVPKLRARAVHIGPEAPSSWRRAEAPRSCRTERADEATLGQMLVAGTSPSTNTYPRGVITPCDQTSYGPTKFQQQTISFCCINLGKSAKACLGGSYTYPRAGALPPGENDTTAPAECCQGNETQYHSSGSKRFSYSNELA